MSDLCRKPFLNIGSFQLFPNMYPDHNFGNWETSAENNLTDETGKNAA